MFLSILSLAVGYFIISISTALLYSTWLSGAGGEITPQFLAVASVCGLGFATLGGWLAALIAQRAPMIHVIGLSLMLTTIWGIYTTTNTVTGGTAEPLALSTLNLAIAILGVVTGGWLRLRQINAQDQATDSA